MGRVRKPVVVIVLAAIATHTEKANGWIEYKEQERDSFHLNLFFLFST
jgi:hypothetical protein